MDDEFEVEDNGNVVDFRAERGTLPEHVSLDDDDDSSEMESALENVADLVCASWEVFGSDAVHSVVTDVDGKLVRLTISVENVS